MVKCCTILFLTLYQIYVDTAMLYPLFHRIYSLIVTDLIQIRQSPHTFQFRITFTCSMALLDLLLLWWIHFKQSGKSHWFLFAYCSGLASAELLNAGLLCVIRCWHCTFRRYACTAVNIDDLTSQTTSNNKDSANVEIVFRLGQFFLHAVAVNILIWFKNTSEICHTYFAAFALYIAPFGYDIVV